MGAIRYTFDNVPAAAPALPQYPRRGLTTSTPEDDQAAMQKYEAAADAIKAFRRRVTGIYGDLRAKGLAVPAVPEEEITRDQLVSHLQEVVGAAVKQEVDANRELYAVLEDDQAALVLQRLQILEGIPYAPNLLSAEDVAAARS